MTFVSGYWMVFNLFKLDQIYNSILCNTIEFSSTTIIVSKMIEYGQVPFPFNVNKLCSDKTMICLDIDPA